MASSTIKVQIKGDKELKGALAKFPAQTQRYMRQAADEAAEEALGTVGLQQYPPAGPGNMAPTPFYVRGRGMQYARRNDNSSERYGSKWTIRPQGYGVVVGNSASYAAKLTDDQHQKPVMAKIGWRKLYEVIAKDKWQKIVSIFDAWAARLVKDCGLK